MIHRPESDPRTLLETLNIEIPPMVCYHTAEPPDAEKTVAAPRRTQYCLFQFFPRWLKGESLYLTAARAGCGGCAHWLFGVIHRSRKEFIRFLVEDEGLKQDAETMGRWIDSVQPYRPETGGLCFGPYRREAMDSALTVTFFVNPDQLAALIIGAHYHHMPEDEPPVTAPFGSGCMQLLTLFERLDAPQALIGGTDTAMRKHLPPDILAFTVTIPMFYRLCGLGKKSFLFKPFWKDLQSSRS